MPDTMDSATTCPFPRAGCPAKSCFLRRLSAWIWSAWPTGSTPSAAAPLPAPPDSMQERHNNNSTWGEQSNLLECDREEYSCRACQTRGVTCDRQKPRCAHCLDQQILCFYVPPPRKMAKSTRRAQANSPVSQSTTVPASIAVGGASH